MQRGYAKRVDSHLTTGAGAELNRRLGATTQNPKQVVARIDGAYKLHTTKEASEHRGSTTEVHQQAHFDPYLGIFSGPLISPGLTCSASREAGSLSGTISICKGGLRIKAFDGWRSRLRRITLLRR
jgi:hypothetical protein